MSHFCCSLQITPTRNGISEHLRGTQRYFWRDDKWYYYHCHASPDRYERTPIMTSLPASCQLVHTLWCTFSGSYPVAARWDGPRSGLARWQGRGLLAEPADDGTFDAASVDF